MATISSNIALTRTQDYFNKISSVTNLTKDRISVYEFVQGLYDLKLWNNIVCWPLVKNQNTGAGRAAYSLGGLGSYTGIVFDSSLKPLVLEQNIELAILQEDGEYLYATATPVTNVWEEEGFKSSSIHSEYIIIPNGSKLLAASSVSSGAVFTSNNTTWNNTYYWLYGNDENSTTNTRNGGGFKESNGVGLVNHMREQNLIETLSTPNASNGTFQFFANITDGITTKDYLGDSLLNTRSIPPFDPSVNLPEGRYSYQMGRLRGIEAGVTGMLAFQWVINYAITEYQLEQLFALYKDSIGKNTI